MGRRKRVLDDGDDSDSSNGSDGLDPHDFNNNDPDAREERALFEDPYQRKRRRKNGKEDAIYGVFGEDSEDEGYGRKPAERKKRSDWAKAPAFVSSDKKVDQTMDVDFGEPQDEDMKDADSSAESSEGEDDNEAPEEGDDSDTSEPSRPTSTARVEDEPEEEEEERPRFGAKEV
ncbi:hypothetical protein NMY22_g17566 [Coprinellus aureogranulatus]|nr:hypothetical protein NMY22_g17566 [Coprinellus aureogranulatus]